MRTFNITVPVSQSAAAFHAIVRPMGSIAVNEPRPGRETKLLVAHVGDMDAMSMAQNYLSRVRESWWNDEWSGQQPCQGGQFILLPGNAIRFTSEGGVDVKLTSTWQEDVFHEDRYRAVEISVDFNRESVQLAKDVIQSLVDARVDGNVDLGVQFKQVLDWYSETQEEWVKDLESRFQEKLQRACTSAQQRRNPWSSILSASHFVNALVKETDATPNDMDVVRLVNFMTGHGASDTDWQAWLSVFGQVPGVTNPNVESWGDGQWKFRLQWSDRLITLETGPKGIRRTDVPPAVVE